MHSQSLTNQRHHQTHNTLYLWIILPSTIHYISGSFYLAQYTISLDHSTPHTSDSEPLPLPFKNANTNILDSSEIAKADQSLTSVTSVLSKYPKLWCVSKIATLAVKFAKKAIFGILGEWVYPGLPVQNACFFLKFKCSQFLYQPKKYAYFSEWLSLCIDTYFSYCHIDLHTW